MSIRIPSPGVGVTSIDLLSETPGAVPAVPTDLTVPVTEEQRLEVDRQAQDLARARLQNDTTANQIQQQATGALAPESGAVDVNALLNNLGVTPASSSEPLGETVSDEQLLRALSERGFDVGTPGDAASTQSALQQLAQQSGYELNDTNMMEFLLALLRAYAEEERRRSGGGGGGGGGRVGGGGGGRVGGGGGGGRSGGGGRVGGGGSPGRAGPTGPAKPADPAVASGDNGKKLAYAEQRAKELGLTITSKAEGYPGDGVHSNTSYHYQGRAIDVAGDPGAMAQFYRDMAAYSPTELFYDPEGGIKHGQQIGAIGGHSDHVHIAF